MNTIVASAALPTTGASMPSGSLPLIDPANEPAAIRNGDKKAQDAYQTGLAFENLLVTQLAQQLAATVPGLDGSDDGLGQSSDDSSDAGSTGSTGGVGGGGGLGAYSSLLPQTLTSSIMQGGGTGIAMQIAKSIDPGLGVAKK
jgi:hypothetical protein